jgi:Mrp family chromosome partitioning ATPase
MGRTFEALGRGQGRKSTGSETVAALPFPRLDPEPLTVVNLVPLGADDLPTDDNNVPFVEVGGPRPTTSIAAGPQLLPPKAAGVTSEVAFQLLPQWDARPVTVGQLSPDLLAYHKPDHPTAKQYRALAEGIAGQLMGNRAPVLLFTPTSDKAALSTMVLNLAITRANEGQGRVLVIEIERTPNSAATRLGIPPLPGLRELLARTVPLTLAIHRSCVESLYFLPAGAAHTGTDEALRLAPLLEQLRGRFDWIIAEAPAWQTRRLNEWAKASDGVYLVMGQGEWDAPEVDAAHDGIARAGGLLRGCITTRG